MTTESRMCRRCGRSFSKDRDETFRGGVCPRCRVSSADSTEPRHPEQAKVQETAAEFLMSCLGPNAPEFSRGSIITLGIAGLVIGLGFGGVGFWAILHPELELPPMFVIGMLGLSFFCFVIGLACFIPKTRWWALPVIAVGVGLFLILARMRLLRR